MDRPALVAALLDPFGTRDRFAEARSRYGTSSATRLVVEPASVLSTSGRGKSERSWVTDDERRPGH